MESRKTVLMSLFAGQEWGCRHRERACGHSRGGRGWDGLSELRWHIDTTRCKTVSSVGSFYAAQGAQPDALGRPRGWDWGGRLQGEGVHTHTLHTYARICVHMTDLCPTQHCKAIFLQFKTRGGPRCDATPSGKVCVWYKTLRSSWPRSAVSALRSFLTSEEIIHF